MTISTTGNQIAYTGDGSSTAFAFPYPFTETTDLKVYVSGALVSTGYTVTGTISATDSGVYQSGTVTFVSAPALSAAVVLYCDPDLLQSTSLPANGPFPAKTVEKMLDKVTLQEQRLSTRVDGAVRAPDGETLAALPSASARANSTLAFDSSGDPTVAVPASGSAADVLTQLADFTDAGKGAAKVGLGALLAYPVNTLGRAINDFNSVRGRLANDGATNDLSALSSILSALPDGAAFYLFDFTGNGYRLTGTITLSTTKSIRLFGANSKIKTANSGTTPVFKINNASSAITDPRHQIDGFRFQAVTTGAGVAVQVTDSQEQAVRNCAFEGFDAGVLLQNSTIWTEGTALESLSFYDCNSGIRISKGTSSAASLAGTRMRDINVMSMFNATSATPKGIEIQTGASIYRGEFDSVIIFPDKNNAVGFYCDGDLSDISGEVHIENTRGSVTGNVGIKLDTNTTGANVSMWSDIRGTIATNVSIVGSLQVQGWKVGNKMSAPAMFKKSSVITYLRGICDDDLSTARFYERVNGSGVLQWLASSSAPAEMRDITTPTVFAPFRHTIVGTGTNDVTSTGAAQVITPAGYDCLRFSPSSASSWSTVSGMLDGQVLDVFLFNGNATINHNDVANGIVNKSGAAYVGAGTTKRYRYIVDRLREI